MFSIYTLKETLTSGHYLYNLNIISLFAILFAILVIIDNNPIKSLLYLIGVFLTISLYLNFVGLTFIGLAYLVIYIGAVSILFIFILMLINIRTSELQSNTNNSLSLALIIAIIFNFTLLPILPNFSNRSIVDYTTNYNVKDTKSFVTSSNWDNNLIENSNITSIGNIMYTYYSIWLLLASLILLLAMVGAIIITIKQEK